jgi:carbamoyl-phosphate synthase large subunit
MSEEFSVLFLGAGRLLQLMEYFRAYGARAGRKVSLASVELDRYCAIAKVARIIEGPKFTEPGAHDFLRNLIASERFDLVIPNMDAATVLLSAMAEDIRALGAMPVVSNSRVCEAMNDKILADQAFAAWGARRPPLRIAAPAIAKYRFGYGSRGIYKLMSDQDFTQFMTRPDAKDHIVQAVIDGPEYTVDAYVDRKGHLVDALIRQRLHVEGGIVVDSITRKRPKIAQAVREIVANTEAGWFGPLTIQFMEKGDDPYLIEINPRFGGGATHALGCGLDMPAWLAADREERDIVHEAFQWPDGHRMTRARIDVYHAPDAG